jgi:hypothetical protein
MRRHRYSIMGVQSEGTSNAVEICQCDTSPEQLVLAAKEKTIQRSKAKMYQRVYVMDFGEENK